MVTSNRTIRWIENLADQELRIQAGERGSIDISTTKEEVLAVETSTFVGDLFRHVEYLVRLFNQKVSQPGLKIKLLRDEEGSAGFRLSRNETQLVVGRPRLGVISLVCMRKLTSGRPTVLFSGQIEATFGSFHDLHWNFLGSEITSEQVARHYLTEYIQVSRLTH